ncbi:phospholipase D family nuclease (plasmid) [Cupriavidus basilensis]
MRTHHLAAALLAVASLLPAVGQAFSFSLPEAVSVITSASTDIEAAFSPDAGALDLVLKVIGSAKQSVRVSAYSFTSAPVTKALLDARRRGVDVQLVVDHRNNLVEDRSGKAAAALGALATAGIPVRTISTYAIHHDKFLCVDGRTVETGSFNYSDAAARRNSENVLVIWDRPDLARQYLRHWQSRFNAGTPYRPSF